MRHPRACPDTRAGCERKPRRFRDFPERKSVELRHYFALEPRLVTLARVLARPVAIAAMALADSLASRLIRCSTAARIVAGCRLCCEGFARSFHRAEAMLASRFGHAVLAMPAPALEHRLAAQRARLHYRPFVERDGRYYYFYHSGFEDRVTEIIEQDIFRRFPAREASLRRKRDDYLEEIATDLLVSLVKPDRTYRN
jgi:hypothetical protein